MVLAILEFSDFLIIAVLAVLSGVWVAASVYLRPFDRARLQRIEHKVDLIMTHLGLDYTPPPKTVWQELADDSTRKIEAIKTYREEHGVGLAEARQAVEEYIAKGGGRD